jgi:hypothetical protein
LTLTKGSRMSDIPDEAVEAAAANVNRLLDKRASQDLLATSHEIANAALTAAYPHLLDEDWRTDWENDLLANAPEWLDDDVAQCEIVTRYVRWLEAENARLRAQVEAAEKELAIIRHTSRKE